MWFEVWVCVFILLLLPFFFKSWLKSQQSFPFLFKHAEVKHLIPSLLMQLSIIRLAGNRLDANSPWSKAAAGVERSHLDSAHVSFLSLFFILLFSFFFSSCPPSCFFIILTVSCRLNYLWFQLANKIPHDIPQFCERTEAWLILIWSNICMCTGKGE